MNPEANSKVMILREFAGRKTGYRGFIKKYIFYTDNQ
jgi:hypothetical protein